MYYAKFSNNQLIDTIKDASFTLYNVYITYSNNVIVLNYKGVRSGYNDTYVILKEGIIKDDYIYLPLNEDNKTYYINIYKIICNLKFAK